MHFRLRLSQFLVLVVSLVGCGNSQPSDRPHVVITADAGADTAEAIEVLPYHETVSAGTYHTCMLRENRQAHCFGLGSDARADEGQYDFDQAVPPQGEFVQISSGVYHTCGLRRDGRLECWGHGSDPTTVEEPAELDHDQAVPPEGRYLAVSVGRLFGCAIREDRALRCWGSLDDEDRAPAGEWQQISAGWHHACGVKADGSVGCVGLGKDPNVDEDPDRDFDQAVPPDGEFVQVAGGEQHTCGLRADGTLSCWGLGSELVRDEGSGDWNQAVAPQGRFMWISAASRHSCALYEDGQAKCWGFGIEPGRDRLGDMGQSEPPAGAFVELSTRRGHTCARTEDGGVECWGKNALGESDPNSEYGAGGCERVDHGDYAFYECSPLCQRGCDVNETCALDVAGSETWITRCIAAGDAGLGEACADSRCEVGLGCFTSTDHDTCHSFCRSGSRDDPQCPDGYQCNDFLSVGVCVPR